MKTKYVCSGCGYVSPVMIGKCYGCSKFGTMIEEVEMTGTAAKGAKTIIQDGNAKSQYIHEVDEKDDSVGYTSGMEEFDRVLGGKIVEGSLVLIGGEPGKGKSTVLLQLASYISEHVGKVIYFSGEESEKQTKLRWKRLGLSTKNLKVLHTRDIEKIEQEVENEKPVLIIVDSIQTVGDATVTSEPGSVSQIKVCTGRLMHISKGKGVTTFIVGQVTKDANIAGPKLLEHMVDTVLYLEGDKYSDLRLIRAIKNRFGSSNELGVFLMEEDGMIEVKNPSELLLSSRSGNASGSAVVCVSDKRPLLIEVQSLVSPPIAQGVPPRRTSEGFNRNRLSILVAVLEKRCNVPLSYKDIFLNVVGGMDIEEPSADLGVAMAIYSSDKNLNIGNQTVILGEVGLTGEVRQVPHVEQMLNECDKVGFQTCILPKRNYEKVKDKFKSRSIKLIPVETVKEAIEKLFPAS